MFAKKSLFLLWWPLEPKLYIWGKIWELFQIREFKLLSIGVFRLLLSSIVFEISEIVWSKVTKLKILTFGDLWWPQFWPERKKIWNSLVIIFDELSNAVFCFRLRLMGAELEGERSNAPPPVGGGKSRGPVGRGLKGHCHLQKSCQMYVNCMSHYGVNATDHEYHI